MGQLAEIVVKQRHEAIERLLAAVAPLLNKSGNIVA
jgi:hypothetical protein